MFDEPIRCALIHNPKFDAIEPTFEFQTENGDPLSKNELIDIGRENWRYKYPAEKTIFTWKFLNYTPDIADRYWQMRTFAAVFRTIGFIIPRKYWFVRNESKSDFTIRFTDDIEVFGGRKMVIAHAYLFHPQGTKNGVTEWNDNMFFTPFGDSLPAYLVDHVHYTEGEKWTDGTLKMLGTQPLLHVGMHEFKHIHGYHHNELSERSILYPIAKRGYNSDDTINEDAFIWSDSDIQRWEQGYGRRFFRRLNHFRARRLRGRFVKNVPYRVAV